MEENLKSAEAEPVSTRSKFSELKLAVNLKKYFFALLLIFLSAFVGYFIRSSQTPRINPTNKNLAPSNTPLIKQSVSTTTKISEKIDIKDMLKKGTKIEYCSPPWDYVAKDPKPGDHECILIDLTNGYIEKNVTHYSESTNSKILFDNATDDSTKAGRIITQGNIFYSQIVEKPILEWLEKPRIPPIGSFMTILKIHSKYGLEAFGLTQYLITGSYLIEYDGTQESKKFDQVIAEMKALAPTFPFYQNEQ